MAKQESLTILRIPTVCDRTGLSRSMIYLLCKRGEFPTPIRLTERTIGWPEEEVGAWLEQRRALGYQPHTPPRGLIEKMVVGKRAKRQAQQASA